MSKTTTVNGIEAETGCWIDGHEGWRAVGLLCSIAADFGWKPGSELDEGALTYFGDTDREDHGELLERVIDMADEAEDWLNDHTPDGFLWRWFDGEFFLSHWCGRGEYEPPCDDETCYCQTLR